MEITETVAGMESAIKKRKDEGKSVGLVPTMGCLHGGHDSLVAAARRENDCVAVSIFINPAQFAPGEDLADYPRDFKRDASRCESLGADIVFHPSPDEMYGEGFCSRVDVSVLSEGLCGRSRPTHFAGVCTVLMKLFHIARPDRAYFGQKDAQQLAIVRRMALDFNMGIKIVACPTVREADGLAKSSRNTYLSEEGRRAARILYQTVRMGEEMARGGERDAAKLLSAMRQNILAEPLARIDYVEAVDGLTMQPVSRIRPPLLVAMAVFIENTRLIDNFILEEL